MHTPSFIYNDVGRAASGFKGKVGDCICRSIAIGEEPPYRELYNELARCMAAVGFEKSARKGVSRKVYQPFLEELGWVRTPTMTIGSGCKVHLRSDELPSGRLIVRVSRHITAVIDGTVNDTFNHSRGGTRCVYGYFSKPEITGGDS